jgi:hypothetical protein
MFNHPFGAARRARPALPAIRAGRSNRSYSRLTTA